MRVIFILSVLVLCLGYFPQLVAVRVPPLPLQPLEALGPVWANPDSDHHYTTGSLGESAQAAATSESPLKLVTSPPGSVLLLPVPVSQRRASPDTYATRTHRHDTADRYAALAATSGHDMFREGWYSGKAEAEKAMSNRPSGDVYSDTLDLDYEYEISYHHRHQEGMLAGFRDHNYDPVELRSRIGLLTHRKHSSLQTPYTRSSTPSLFPLSEWLALQALFNATDGPGWRWYGTGAQWDFRSPMTSIHNPCYNKWEGVLCSCNLTKPMTIYKEFYPYYLEYYDYHTSPPVELTNTTCSVVKLFLNRHNLHGTIPRQIGDIEDLTHIHLKNNEISGSFPSGLLRMSKLQILEIGFNRIVGALPSNVTRWASSLQVLTVSNNRFTSTLPVSWSMLTRLQLVDLDSNSIVGSLPEQWSTLSKLKYLNFAINSLSGSLPQSWSQLSALQSLGFHLNFLRGTLPSSWSKLSSLQLLYISSNSLCGTLPPSWSTLNNLQYLDLTSNSLNGALPTSWSALIMLQLLYLSSNSLDGMLPSSWSSLKGLRFAQFYSSSLRGALPQSWSALSRLQQLILHSNSLNGTLPESWSTLTRLQQLELYSNSLEGTLPSSWSTLSIIRKIVLNSNDLQGELPQSWSALRSLQQLYLYSNTLQGSLPQSWSTLSRLQQILLASNRLTGVLPESWSALSGLQEVYLFSNSLHGTLPQSWSSMTSLRILYLYNNTFTGTVPHQWFTLFSLKRVLLNSNSLQGSIPADIAKLKSLQWVLLDNNYFTGVLPTSLFQLSSLKTLSFSVNCFAVESFTVSNICAARNLSVLVMDGIHSASQCGNMQLFASNSLLDLGGAKTYTLPQQPLSSENVEFPLCLLSLPLLSTLHVSGAGLVGNLSAIDAYHLSPDLTDLVLSHNYLYGSIPSAIQRRTSWYRLDLSFNLLGGTLSPELSLNASTTKLLDISNNRLSGIIPSGLLYQPSVSILQGNRFSCALFNTSVKLPVNDPYEAQYSCNGSEFDISVLVWGITLTIVVVAYLILKYWYGFVSRLSFESLFHIFFSKSRDGTGTKFVTINVGMLQISTSAVCLCTLKLVVVALILILVYGLFKLPGYSYTEVTVQGTYLASVTQLVGVTPAVVVAVIYLAVELGGYTTLQYHLKDSNTPVPTTKDGPIASSSSKFPFRLDFCFTLSSINLTNVCRYGLVIAVNMAVVIVINGAYVAAFFAFSSSIVRLISFALSVFKLLWTQAGVPYLLSYIRRSFLSPRDPRSKNSLAHLYTSLVVINTVIVPSLSIIFIAPQCARYVFRRPPIISSSIPFCLLYTGYVDRFGDFVPTFCFESLTVPNTYTPPFLYSNQCSFALLSGYAEVFTYIFILAGFVVPGLVLLLSLYVIQLSKSPESWLFGIFADMLPRWLLPVEHLQAMQKLRTPNKIAQMIRSLMHLDNKRSTASGIKEPSDAAIVGVEFVTLDIPGVDTVSSFHNHFPSQNVLANDIDTQGSSSITSYNSQSASRAPSVVSTLIIFAADETVVQISLLLSICLSFGVVFPPLCLLGAVALILYSLFVQYSVNWFAESLLTASVAPDAVNGTGIQLSEIRKTLDAECLHFSLALRHCLPIPFVASFPVLAFFLWEIVSVSHPNTVGYTIILPIVFLTLAFVCWQLLSRRQLHRLPTCRFNYRRWLRNFCDSKNTQERS